MERGDLATGRRFFADACPGANADTCRLDETALEDVAGLIASSIGPGIDLVII